MTKIQWTDESWNPVVGCTKIAAGCKNCYAEKFAARLAAMGHNKYIEVMDRIDWLHWNGKIYCDDKSLDKPLHWRKPRKIFVCSMSDLFHPKVPRLFIGRVLNVIGKCKQHTFQILTKRPEIALETIKLYYEIFEQCEDKPQIPYPNLWLGTSISNQADADKNIPILLQIPAAVRFVSLEPMLERVDLRLLSEETRRLYKEDRLYDNRYQLHWVIIGCESGPKARLCDIDVIRDAVQQCRDAGVACFVKQVAINGRCNKNPDEWPEDLRIQEYPKCL